jgi:hypothetical protein
MYKEMLLVGGPHHRLKSKYLPNNYNTLDKLPPLRQ